MLTAAGQACCGGGDEWPGAGAVGGFHGCVSVRPVKGLWGGLVPAGDAGDASGIAGRAAQ